ncbi:DUF456 domain-containing protein [Aquimarina sp. ERC-38]|uniref:DUF456 domain-containing protein n=1 Tax=Aquimarina sp. ERC-38 TaxID=2949996 RepID=UPI00224681DB|nr:DUF456 domain-containing protein [Aquimarina sp. ERC-38]UZO81554.1 DUF456 domain-containing protein [Aquimarina sp. ERC-38]
MDIALIGIGFILCIIGIIGSFLPVLPGLFTCWVGLLLLHLTSIIPMNWVFLGITLAISIFVFILDYIIPAIGAKKYGGSKYGIIGATVGLIVGFFIPIPFGIFIGLFAGAFLGEMTNSSNSKQALRAAKGSVLGFLAGTFIEFIVAVAFFVLYIKKVWEHWELITA